MRFSGKIPQEDSALANALDTFVLVVILYSIVSVTIASLPGLSPGWTQFFTISRIVVTLLFTVEYVLRVWFAENRIRYIFSFYGLIDLLSILPFYFYNDADLRMLRAFRLFRLLRIFKLTKYNVAMQRFHRALLLVREEALLFIAATMILLFIASAGIYFFEHETQPEAFKSIPHSMRRAVVTLTTVGYGDVYPVTTGGRVFTFFVVMIGVGIVSVPAGLVSSALSRVRREESGE